ncbi:uncharacterized protein LOC110815425 [Carica papaya]|uniref:uncharacterized protein LOC110815425 n=1 Tax=Carica papaya TaxID=3649 RepID=UPI000B8CC83C|nr:uncharacterized protein LOC110815425 [Carica papaya]
MGEGAWVLVVGLIVLRPIFVECADERTQKLIDSICRSMEEYGFCNRTFNDNLNGPSATIFDLTWITLDQSLNNATNTLHFVLQTLQHTTDPSARIALEICERDFENMLRAEMITPRAQGRCVSPDSVTDLPERNREMRILLAMAIVAGNIITIRL